MVGVPSGFTIMLVTMHRINVIVLVRQIQEDK